jgi:hypothetical protein
MAKALRDNNGKPELDYLLQFPTATQAFCRVKELGAIKYERGNWKKGGKPDHEYTSACLRHLVAFARGEYYADDSGCAHLAHAMWNLMALMELNYPDQIIDEELFKKMCDYWKEKRQAEKASAVSLHTTKDIFDGDFIDGLRETIRRELRTPRTNTSESVESIHVSNVNDDYMLINGRYFNREEAKDMLAAWINEDDQKRSEDRTYEGKRT